ncbi:low temperature requirement protein A [Plantactinospora sp. CA-290183]|uniref:low temperature requirement protein A n=1 Tax=Plantactinospora sp. CA-290183 TaxID=3240006 RepID=UPI003D8FB137
MIAPGRKRGDARWRGVPGLHAAARLVRLRAPGPAGQDSERHATWLELFFDLVIVLALTSATARLGTDASPDTRRALTALGVFLLVQWAWFSQSFYDTRFDPDDGPHRLLVFAAAIGAGGLALGAHQVPHGLLLPIGYLLLRGALILMYLRVFGTRRSARPVATVYLAGFGTGWLLWLASLALAPSTRPVLWAVALLLELSTPWLGHRWLARHPVDRSHLPERVGQYVIILLGSTLANLLSAVPLHGRNGEAVAAAAVAFLVPACLWWVYTTFLTSGLAASRLRGGQGYAYLHAPVGAAILFLGWALGQVVREVAAGSERLPGVLRLVLGVSIGVWMLTGLALHRLSLGAVARIRLVLAFLGVAAAGLVMAVVTRPLLALTLTAAVLVGYAIVVSREIVRVGPAPANHP